MSEMKKEKTNLIEKLFLKWRQQQNEESDEEYKKYGAGEIPKNAFLPDGIVDEAQFAQKKQAGKAVMFVAKEANWYNDDTDKERCETAAGDASFWVRDVAFHDVPETMFYNTRLFHTSGITLGLGGNAQKFAIECIRKFKEQGTLISFDVNYRANLWTGEEARACIEQILPYVDIFFCSEDTARLTFGKTGTIEEIQKSFCEEYPISVVASTERTVITPKKHNFTSIIYSAKNDSYYREEPYNNIDVVDRIGSGDAYVSGALYGYLKHKDCRKALEYGNAMAAIKHSVIGDMITTDLEEIDSIIAEHKNTGYHSEMNR